ncbi:MAG: T9SS type A sorting domain-containing protein [Bacteroidetes bacterium]|nr:T9SS type A sorting domain-containing protein [Bacteroidota bacterium]
MKKSFLSILFIFFLNCISNAQFVKIPLIVSDGSSNGIDTLFFGIDPAATNGIDAAFGEQELPPQPPTGVFDARFIDTQLRDSIMFAQGTVQGLAKDYRQGSNLTESPRTHEVQFKKGSGSIIQFNMPQFPSGVTLRFVDLFGGFFLDTTFTSPGSLTNNYFNLSDKVFMYAQYQRPQPVELISFTHIINGNNVLLKWVTSLEINNSGFEVQRKKNSGNNWTALSFIKGHNNSNQTHEYSYEDLNLPAGTYSYRLKQIDFNGNFEYLDLYETVVIGSPLTFQLYQNFPNPFNPSTLITFQIPESGLTQLRIFDAKGNLVEKLIEQELNEGYYKIRFNAANIPSGIYFYRLEYKGNLVNKKMIVTK